MMDPVCTFAEKGEIRKSAFFDSRYLFKNILSSGGVFLYPSLYIFIPTLSSLLPFTL
jgi:hypothetical protein